MRKSTLIVAFASSAALVVASAGTSLASGHTGKAVGNSGHAVALKAGPAFTASAGTDAGFKAYDNPTKKYKKKSCVIDLSGYTDFDPVSQIKKQCKAKIKFSTTFEKRSVPNSWASWGPIGQTEDDMPNILYSNTATTATIDFGKTVTTGGLELEPNQFQIETVTVEFHAGANGSGAVVGSITRDVNGDHGALLFGGTSSTGWKSAVITDPFPDDFSIAQIRV